MTQFQLVSEFEPTGDQPEAIAQLVDGVGQGYKHQTLLGATGTGKSLDGDEPILVYERRGASMIACALSIGELVEQVLRTSSKLEGHNGTVLVRSAVDASDLYVWSFAPGGGAPELKQVTAFIRHAAPDRMYRAVTACGRKATMTGDHNLWVLRDGDLALVPTSTIKSGDYIPIPCHVPGPEQPLASLDLLNLLQDSGLFVEADEPMLAAVQQEGRKVVTEALGEFYRAPESKVYAILNSKPNARFPMPILSQVLDDTDGLYGCWDPSVCQVFGRTERCALPLQLPVTAELLRLMGLYLAEGNGQPDYSYFIWSNRLPALRDAFEQTVSHLGIPFTVRPSSDYQVSSAALARLLSGQMGSTASEKHLPSFWPQLDNTQLATLLRAYFDGDGWVERWSAVCALTASERLASELVYALLRFGIWARIRRVWKRATNSAHEGDWYWMVTISSQDNLRLFADNIGFSLERKKKRLEAQLRRQGHSNVDLVPGCGHLLRELREGLGLYQRQLGEQAELSRSVIGLFEQGKRNPRRQVLERLLDALESLAGQQPSVDDGWWQVMRYLRGLLAVRWTPVLSIEAVAYDRPYVYDLSVADHETFLAGRGGMFVHNTYVVSQVIEQTQKPTLVLTHNKTLAAQLYAEFREFFPHNAVEYFVSYYDYYQPEAYIPKHDLYIEKDADINEEIQRLRLAATTSLFVRQDVIIVASVSCIYALGNPQEWGRVMIELKQGEKQRRNGILRHLVSIYYKRNDLELQPGTFRVRGDTLEVMPAYGETAYRFSFWGDEIERITEVSTLTGEVLQEMDEVRIFPAKNFVTPEETLDEALADIETELEQRLHELRSQDKLLEAQRLEQRTQYDLEMIREIGYCSGIENYSRHLERRPPGAPPWTLLDYFPGDYLLVVDESHMAIPQVRGMYNGDRSRKGVLVDFGFRLPSAMDNRPLNFDEFEERLNQVIYTSATPGPYELEKSQQVVQQIIRPTGVIDPQIVVKPVQGQVDDLIGQINERIGRGERVLVTTLTKRMAEDLADYLKELGVKVHYLHSEVQTLERVEILRDLRLGAYDVVVGINLLREGLDLPEVSLVAILDADKEGFLRSDTALIQTVGRAARHVDGTAIMYADRITDSMQRAIEETERRRKVQEAYNEEHGIVPASIVKEVHDLTERMRVAAGVEKVEEERGVAQLSKDELTRLVHELERQMKAAAKELEFEKAALLRDQIYDLRALLADKEEADVPAWERERRMARLGVEE